MENNKSIILKLKDGDFGLITTFLIFYILGNILIALSAKWFLDYTIPNEKIIVFIFATYISFTILYLILVVSGIWKSANRYQGPKYIVYIIKFFVATTITINVIDVLMLIMEK
jgi:hypothetical protein